MDLSERNSRYPHRRRTPSFSSTLLDTIFRSIDESNELEPPQQLRYGYEDDHLFLYNKQAPPSIQTKREERVPSLQRAIMVDQWMENYRSNSISRNSRRFGSYSSSSDSSSGGDTAMFSSSSSSSRSSNHWSKKSGGGFVEEKTAPKREVRFLRSTRLRALKMYTDLKKAKQPISPGGRISNFLNSIFTKKPKIEQVVMELKKSTSVRDSSSRSTAPASNPDSSTAFSRSCLSKTRGSSNAGTKRSVRFYPDDQYDLRSMPMRIPAKLEPVRCFSNNYNNQAKNVISEKYAKYFEAEDEDDDNESCASSDLFELEIVGDGIGAYREAAAAAAAELPVFETTDFRKNQAIANGLIR